MVLGNIINGISIGLSTVVEELSSGETNTGCMTGPGQQALSQTLSGSATGCHRGAPLYDVLPGHG